MSTTKRVALAGLVTALLAAACAWAIVQRHDLPGERAIDRARADAIATTLDVVPRLLSYDPATLDQDLTQARAALTTRFRPQFEELQKELIEPAVGKEKVRTAATVQKVGVTSATASRVRLVVFLEQRTVKAGNQAALLDTRAVVTLRRVGNAWLVDDLRPV